LKSDVSELDSSLINSEILLFHENISTIFLDFDGVLHPTHYLNFQKVDGELIFSSDARCCWADLLWNLITDFECGLVIHSSWRNSYTLQDFRNMLPTDLGKRVIAVTEGQGRYESILNYVKRAHVKNYLILDDAADEFPDGCRELLLCDSDSGISSKKIQSALLAFLKKSKTP
jgi:hypothetical protein